MKPLLIRALLPILLLTLAACSYTTKSMFPPSVTVQQLEVLPNGQWRMQVRILNNSYGGMDFQVLHLDMNIDGQLAARIEARPGLMIPALSPDVLEITVHPSPAAVQALAGIAHKGSSGALGYSMSGRVEARPEKTDSSRSFDVDNHDWLSAVPGVNGLYR